MPPKPTGKPAASKTASKTASRDLVPVGPRHVSTKAPGHLSTRSSKNQSKRDEHGEKPTTSRAIVLRNGKHGARGTGELMLVSKLTGREKLDLIAGTTPDIQYFSLTNAVSTEDLVEQSRKAILNPFRLDQCHKIATSQCNGMDAISNIWGYFAITPVSQLFWMTSLTYEIPNFSNTSYRRKWMPVRWVTQRKVIRCAIRHMLLLLLQIGKSFI